MRIKSSLLSLAAATALSLPGVASAQLTNLGLFTGTGGGFGNTGPLLTLAAQGNSGGSLGCIAPGAGGTTSFSCTNFGTGGDVLQSQSTLYNTSLFSSTGGITGNNFGLVFNINEPQNVPGITLDQLLLTLYGQNGATQTFSLASGPLDLVGNPGTGSYGYVFGLSPAAQLQFDQFIAANTQNNGVVTFGLSAQTSNAGGGAESFFITNTVGTTINTVPEPSTYVLMASGLLALGIVARRRRRV